MLCMYILPLAEPPCPCLHSLQISISRDLLTLLGRHHPSSHSSPYLILQVAKLQAAALSEDPSIFDYDSHYDTLQNQREAAKPAAAQARKSRYIESLLDKNKERQREQDIIYERKSVFLFPDFEKPKCLRCSQEAQSWIIRMPFYS